MVATVSEKVLGTSANNELIKQFMLRNAQGAEARFLNLGAAWVGFQFSPDTPNLVLGCDSLDAYLKQGASLGATVGRFANRINAGQFNLNGNLIQLSVNSSPHHIHGGHSGFANKVWQSHIELVNSQPTLTLRYQSPDKEEGYPGNLDVTVEITLTDDNEVIFNYHAQTDASTIVNLTNHAYFNLQGTKKGHINDHEFKINSDTYLVADTNALPTGELKNVKGSALDLTNWTNIAQNLVEQSDDNLARAGGYDHCYCFAEDNTLKTVAQAQCDGITLSCSTTLPGMQFYTGNFLGGTPINDIEQYANHGAFCFEPGYWPDSPNHDHFTNCIFDKSQPYAAIIKYRFTN